MTGDSITNLLFLKQYNLAAQRSVLFLRRRSTLLLLLTMTIVQLLFLVSSPPNTVKCTQTSFSINEHKKATIALTHRAGKNSMNNNNNNIHAARCSSVCREKLNEQTSTMTRADLLCQRLHRVLAPQQLRRTGRRRIGGRGRGEREEGEEVVSGFHRTKKIASFNMSQIDSRKAMSPPSFRATTPSRGKRKALARSLHPFL